MDFTGGSRTRNLIGAYLSHLGIIKRHALTEVIVELYE